MKTETILRETDIWLAGQMSQSNHFYKMGAITQNEYNLQQEYYSGYYNCLMYLKKELMETQQ